MGRSIDMGWKGLLVDVMLNPQCDLDLWSWPWIFKLKLWNSCSPRMGRSINIERKGCKLIGCWTHYVTLTFKLNHDLGLGFSRLKFHSLISGMGGSKVWYDVGPTMQQPWTCNMGWLTGYSTYQIRHWPCKALMQNWLFPSCGPINGLSILWSMGWGVLSFPEHLVCGGFIPFFLKLKIDCDL